MKQYFSLDSVTKGLLEIYQKMLGLTFTKVQDGNLWHQDVTMYEVNDTETGDFVGHFYMDLFPREGKYNHAACFPFRRGFAKPDGTRQYPVSAIVANFPKPTKNAPALLKHDDVTTYFHEFGHVMHNICSKVQFKLFSGTSVERDFVEAPSQMLENWCWEPEVLEKFAVHYQTNQPIPRDLVAKLVKSRHVGAGLSNLYQLFSGLFDMALHNTENTDIDTTKLYTQMREEITKLKTPSETIWRPLATFGHLMGGYDSAYYGYLWSLVFAADMFSSRFKKEGIDNEKTGLSYRKEILQPGGSKDANDLIYNFLGREPNDKAFLTKLGLDV